MNGFETRLLRELSSMGIDITSRELHHAIDDARDRPRSRSGCCSHDGFEPSSRRRRYDGDLDRMGSDFARAVRRGDLGRQDRITDELGRDVDWDSRSDERRFRNLDRAGEDIRTGDVDFGRGALRDWGRDRGFPAGKAEEEAHGIMQKLRQAIAAEQSGRDGLKGPLSGESVRELRRDAETLARALERDGYGDQADSIFAALDNLSNRTDGHENRADL